jgi:hypothetical protein
MGMDPISVDESYEVTIQVDGPVNAADFQKFRDELGKFLAKFPTIPNTHPNKKKPFLQVRESRGGQRKNA